MKNLLRFGIGGLLVLGAASFAVPETADAYSTLGFSLGLSQRDFRVYDNFTNAAANNNTTPHPNWPGYTGAELALWKGGAEWGTREHGDGSGDPLQTVGNGGAHFSFVWNGNASGTGSIGTNIISGIGGSSGGVLAFMQGGSGGWWVRFYLNWNWQDGPGAISSGFDLQSVGCHEVGHSLGLGHSNVGGSTMWPSIGSGSESQRSIGPDDEAGVQAIYGSVDNSRNPRIDSLSGSTAPGGTMVVVGSNYSTSNNEVWFNRDLLNGSQSGGDPVKVTGLASSAGGTQISVTVPNSGVEQGSIHVKKNTSGGVALSEAEPFDLDGVVIDSISLTGPTVGFVNQPISYNIDTAPANAPYTLYFSLQANGSQFMGHPIDLSGNLKSAGTGTINSSGSAVFTRTIPPSGRNRTVYLEVIVNLGGVISDSNVVQLDIF